MKDTGIARVFPPLQYLGAANIITTFVIASGFVSAFLFANGHLHLGFTLLIIGITLDRLDGMVARAMNDHTPLGEQLDSLADALTFCFLPAFAAYNIGFTRWFDVIVLVLYVSAGLWRLAYFNISGLNEVDNKQYFIGIPTTICASWFAVLSPFWINTKGPFITSLFFIYFISCTIMLVSAIRYNKNGIWTKLLYFLLPLIIIYLWL